MFPRVVSLLVPCALLIQSAAVGHVHGGVQTAEHDLHPHLHTSQFHHDHDDHHDHGIGRHFDHVDCDDESDAATASVPPSEGLPDHDDDAVYVSDELAVSGHASPFAGSDGARWINPAASVSASLCDFAVMRLALWPHPPPYWASLGCPLYVRHLALLL